MKYSVTLLNVFLLTINSLMNMKKFFVSILAMLAMAVSFVSCSDEDEITADVVVGSYDGLAKMSVDVKNQETGETGWVYNPDKKAFMTYKGLFYRYGKKYGIRFFNDLTEDEKVLYSREDITSKILDKINYPRFVTFTVIRGNWLLATVNDRTKQPKVGWFNWRNDNGTLNMFPNLSEQAR